MSSLEETREITNKAIEIIDDTSVNVARIETMKRPNLVLRFSKTLLYSVSKLRKINFFLENIIETERRALVQGGIPSFNDSIRTVDH